MNTTFSRKSRLSRKRSEAVFAVAVRAAHDSLVRLRTDELEVLGGLIDAELDRRLPGPGTSLLRFETARQPTAAIVAKILRTSFPDAETAVDLTPGHGCFWREDVPIGVTVTLSPHDFRALPYADDSYCVALLDAPHNADAGERSIMGQRFGTYRSGALEAIVMAGVREAWRVARRGIVVKVTDHVHGQRLVLETDWVRAALEWQTPYEIVHQVRGRALVDPRWKDPQLSARNNGSTYLIFRKDGPLHRRGKEDARSIDSTSRSEAATRCHQAADSTRSITALGKAEQ